VEDQTDKQANKYNLCIKWSPLCVCVCMCVHACVYVCVCGKEECVLFFVAFCRNFCVGLFC